MADTKPFTKSLNELTIAQRAYFLASSTQYDYEYWLQELPSVDLLGGLGIDRQAVLNEVLKGYMRPSTMLKLIVNSNAVRTVSNTKHPYRRTK